MRRSFLMEFVKLVFMFQEPGQTIRKIENPSLQRSLDAITSSLNYIGGTIGTAVEVSFLLFMNPYIYV